jgi:hypothetical protein
MTQLQLSYVQFQSIPQYIRRGTIRQLAEEYSQSFRYNTNQYGTKI